MRKRISDVESNSIVPLFISVPTNGQYSFSAYYITGFSDGKKVSLEDKTTNTIQDLSLNANYSFSATTGTTSDRFNLLFGDAVATAIQNATNNPITVYRNDENIIVNSGNISSGTIKISDINGKEILNQKFSSALTSLHLQVDPGIYFVNVQTEENIFIRRERDWGVAEVCNGRG